ncbi:Bacterial DnaG primase, TOPRIM domain [uncultured Caudovirales phage]|uniref:Bacterial DnaG primase, TOPRIM domain n=1 Tax=uncultured Caudovirales phage TaxID=2100421 RepID=A0A6J7WV27_9CAUD|nr:Bacterial DnaG primase, TOPRIM domain [uncultured Caudovirales phage]
MLQRGFRQQAYTSDIFQEDQIREIVKVCGVSIGSELDTHFLVYCPFHYNVHTPACEIDKEKGLFICFSCGENGTLLDFIMRTTKRNYFEAMRVISAAEKSLDFVEVIDKAVEEKPDFVEFDVATIERLHSSLMSSNKAVNYFLGRKITKEAMKHFNLGYSEKQDMVTVPVYSHTDICVGFVGRSIEGKVFKNSTGTPRNKILFNLNNVKFQEVVIVESSFDAIRLWQLGIPAIATLGANLGKIQTQLINKYVIKLILAMDQDDAGSTLMKNLLKNVSVPMVKMNFPDEVKDIGDMTDEQILESHKMSTAFDIALQL